MRGPRAEGADSADTRRAIERWFSTRGVPQLISGYSSEQRIDARAVPLVGSWLVVGTVLIWVQRPGASLASNLGASLLALLGTMVTLGVFLRIRRHPPFGARHRIDLLDIAIVGLVPGVMAALITGDAGAIVGVVTFVLFGVGAIYAVTALGIPELAAWSVRYLRLHLAHIATLVARTLPLLLILVVFLLFASELWQAARTLSGWDLGAVLGLLLVVGVALVIVRAREEIAALQDRLPQMPLDEMLAGTPVRPPVAKDRWRAAPPLGRMERLNLVVLMLTGQLVQSLFVALIVMLFLVALGVLAVPASVQEAWSGGSLREVLGFSLFREPRMVSGELLVASTLLGGMCGLYFTGLALTDAAYRAEFHARVMADIETIMAVRAVYHATPVGHPHPQPG